MKITFYSNFLNHHQLPFCIEMYELLKNEFVFVACARTPEERIKLGYQDMNDRYPFVLKVYDDSNNLQRAKDLIMESDITIHGSAMDLFLKIRENIKKPCFLYSERVFKPGDSTSTLRTVLAYYKHHIFRNKMNTYVLCASYYASFDYMWLGPYFNKCFAWGYFPPMKLYNINELMEKKAKHNKIIILWVGRMIEVKHPECAINTAHYLDEKGIDFELKLIGNGPLASHIQGMIDSYGLDEKIHMLGSMSTEEVRTNFEDASIFLFTSDYNEGWGAVLNESMNSGCAVVASHAIGATGYLIENGKNGIVYPFGNQDEINYWTEQLINRKDIRERLGTNAYDTIKNHWNAHEAATRLVTICDNIIQREKITRFDVGPCCKAVCSSNNTYKKRVKKELLAIKEQYNCK